MSKGFQPVRFRGMTTFQSTTAVGTTTAGAYVQLKVAGNSSAIFGAEIATISTLFARYRVNRLKVSVGPGVAVTTARYWGVKYIGEDSSAPGAVTCLSLLDGMHSDACINPEVRAAKITLTTKELSSSGLEWRECDSATEALGEYGELTVVTENAGAVFIRFEWDISFTDLASSGLHAIPHQAVRALALRGPRALAKLMQQPALGFSSPLARQEENEQRDYEVVSRPSDTPRSVVSMALRGPFQSPQPQRRS